MTNRERQLRADLLTLCASVKSIEESEQNKDLDEFSLAIRETIRCANLILTHLGCTDPAICKHVASVDYARIKRNA